MVLFVEQLHDAETETDDHKLLEKDDCDVAEQVGLHSWILCLPDGKVCASLRSSQGKGRFFSRMDHKPSKGGGNRRGRDRKLRG